jgi:K+-sensing histidine kinase KdpD
LFFSLALALEYELPSDVRPFVEKADVFAHNIERQMAFTRDYQDIGVNSPTWQDVAHVIRRAVKLVDPGKIEIHIDIEGVLFYADPLLEKVFHNLVDNAKRYGEKISGIWFSGFEGPEGYSLICADDGVGIPVEYKLGIFKREYFKHTGFGLNLSREILDMTGIKIVETGLVGIGARFEILVPKGGYKFVENSNAE